MLGKWKTTVNIVYNIRIIAETRLRVSLTKFLFHSYCVTDGHKLKDLSCIVVGAAYFQGRFTVG